MNNFNVSMYSNPPKGSDSLMNQVQMAQERLKLYQILKNNRPVNPEKIKTLLANSPFRFLLDPNAACLAARKIDHHSHWILRIVYSGAHERFFIECEKEWFRMRFNCMENTAKKKFLESENLTLTPVSTERRKELKIDLSKVYQFEYHEIPQLLPLRKYPLIKGYLYVPPEEIVEWLLNKFEKKIKVSLTHIKQALPASNNNQLKTILSFIEMVKPTNYKFDPNFEKVTLKDLDKEAKTNFPLCMRFHHETLRKTHHLKYFSRMQYGLFLKSIGLTLDESLKLWKDEFSHTMSEKRFDQKYSYLFKHHYGTVGSRIDQGPYNCEKIIKEGSHNRGVENQIHGCPFLLWDENLLKSKLEEYGLSSTEIPEIIKLKNKGMYNLACTKCLGAYHACELEEMITHPNQYFEKSRQLNATLDIEDIGNFLDSDWSE